MGERLFDDLARTFATPMPRRRALRVAAGVLVSATVPGLSAGRALASPTRRGDVCKGAPSECNCSGAIAWCPTGCLYHEYKCECRPLGDGVQAVCSPTTTCPEKRQGCGPCCLLGEECNRLIGKCECPPNRERCASKCCRLGERCCPSTRMMPESRCYDPDTQCCSPVAGVVSKYTIRKLEYCPDRAPKRNHRARANGCGPENGIKVPDSPLGADFKPACDYHDICYETCRTPKAFCDRRFHELMRDACWTEYPRGAKRTACLAGAKVYYQAVSKGGADAYEEAQKAACLCC